MSQWQIGKPFAIRNSMVLAAILSRYEVKLVSSRPVKPTRRGLTIAPPTNMRMVVTDQRTQKTQVLADSR